MGAVESLVADVRSVIYSYLTYVDLVKLVDEPVFAEIRAQTTTITIAKEDEQKVITPDFFLQFPQLKKISGAAYRHTVTDVIFREFTTLTFSSATRAAWFAFLGKVNVEYIRIKDGAENHEDLKKLYLLLFRPGNHFRVARSSKLESMAFGIYAGGITGGAVVLRHLSRVGVISLVEKMGINRIYLTGPELRKLAETGNFAPVLQIIAAAKFVGLVITEVGVAAAYWKMSVQMRANAQKVATKWAQKDYAFVLP